MLTLDATEQVEAEERIALVTDIATVASGIWGGKGNPIQKHIDRLNSVRKD